MNPIELYQICIDDTNDLTLRYAALRQLREAEKLTPGKIKMRLRVKGK